MSTESITIKPNNHRIHLVSLEKKAALVTFLLEQNASLSTLLCVSEKDLLPAELQKSETLTIVEDKDLTTLAATSYDLVISYDIPSDAPIYIQRVSKASQKALLVLNTKEQNKLYPIETLLGRTIKQEAIEGFTEVPKVVVAAKKEYKARDERDTSTKPKKYNNEKKQNKFLGKDENGKAIFSGKSGERNHRYDGTPKGKSTSTKLTGKTINVQAKKKESK